MLYNVGMNFLGLFEGIRGSLKSIISNFVHKSFTRLKKYAINISHIFVANSLKNSHKEGSFVVYIRVKIKIHIKIKAH